MQDQFPNAKCTPTDHQGDNEEQHICQREGAVWQHLMDRCRTSRGIRSIASILQAVQQERQLIHGYPQNVY